MNMQKCLAVACLAALTTTGCEAMMALGLGAPKVGPFKADAPKVKLSGKVTVAQAQVAIVAAGGGNIVSAGGGNVLGGNSGGLQPKFGLLAAGEGAFGVSTLRATPYPGAEASFTSSSDNTGRYTVEVPSGTAYKLTFTASGSSGLTVIGLAFVGGGDTSCDLDVAYQLVSAKVAASRKPIADSAKFFAAVTALRLELQDVSKIAAKTEGDASAAFDASASAAVKAQVATI